jgi:xylulokinase
MEKFVAPFLLGIDVGTTGCKTELLDVEGNTLARAYREYPLIYPKISWVEHNAETGWWQATIDTTREVLQKSKVDPKEIKGVSISCTNALVAVDKDGNQLRPAIMQFDKRTIDQVNWIKAKIGDKVIRITGNQPAASGTSAPIILWIKENEPDIFKKTHKFMWPGGFVVQKLTGEFTMEWSRASWTCLFETGGKQRWSEELCADMDIPMDKLPDLCPSWKVVGEVTEKAAQLTGLAKGTPVVGGMADTPAGGIGTGAVSPGDTCHVIGTTARPCVVLGEPKFDSRVVNCCHAVPGCWFSLGVLENAGSSIKWFRDLFGQMEVSMAGLTGQNAFDYLDEEAERSVPGANGIIYLPYLNGERSPIWDPYARGVLFGLSGSHKRADVVRAILEGVAFAFAHNLELFETALGVRMKEVSLSGGGSKSRAWQQIHADVSGKAMKVVKVKESEAIGNSILAGYGVGIYKDMVSAARQVVKIERVVEPRKEYAERYAEMFQIYKNIYLHTKEDFGRLAKLKH